MESNELLRVGIGHLFTTGRNKGRHAILHVAGVCFFSDRDPQEKDWILNPETHITRRMHRKTGLSKAVCDGSPKWLEIREEVVSFFSNLDVLFVFDADNQREWFKDVVLVGVEKPPVIVDILKMSQFFLPGSGISFTEEGILDQFSQGHELKGQYQLPKVARGLVILLGNILRTILHRSLRGRHMAYSLFEHALTAAKAPKDFSGLLGVAAQASQIRWGRGLDLDGLDKPEAVAIDTIKKTLIRDVLESLPTSSLEDRVTDETDPRPINLDTFAESLRRLPTHSNLSFFKSRPRQQQFSLFCAEAMNGKGFYAVEAGTGTGKTLGYLLPACEYVRINPHRQVIVASSTKNLMDQIVEKDWKNVIKEIPQYRDKRIEVLKGKNNYLCLSALKDFFEDNSYTQGDALVRLSWLYLFMVFKNNQGRWEDTPVEQLQDELPALRDMAQRVNAEKACVSGVCAIGKECVYPRSQRRAQAADVVITNHHKLVLLNADQLSAAVCIVDEADQFADNMRSSLTRSLSWKELRDYVNRVGGRHGRRGFLGMLEKGIASEKGQDKNAKEVASLRSRVRTIMHACEEIERQSQVIKNVYKVPETKRWDKLNSSQIFALKKALKELETYFETITREWDNMLSSGRYEEPMATRRQKEEKRKITLYHTLSCEVYEKIGEIKADFPSSSHVHTYRQGRNSWTLSKIPFNTSEHVDSIHEAYETIIFTSATLYVDDNLDFFCRELKGNDDRTDDMFPRNHTERILSPFDFEKRVRGFVATGIPSYGGKNFNKDPDLPKKWKEGVERWISVLSVALYGRTLVLGTNHKEMKEIYERVSPVLEAYDIVPLLQDGVSTAEIETFRRVEHSVLFGVDRFWTGVDFRGVTLSQVIVVRLPVPHMSWPLREHRKKVVYGDKQYWPVYSNPTTRIRLKQGFGRLMRSESDKGLFVLLDRRAYGSGYMSVHARELPLSLQNGRSAIDVAKQGMPFLGLLQEFDGRGIDLKELDARMLCPDTLHDMKLYPCLPDRSSSYEAWEKVYGVVDEGCVNILRMLMQKGSPVPQVGYELMDGSGEIVALAELAWEKERVAGLYEEEEGDRSWFASQGWTVFALETAVADDILRALTTRRS